MNLLHFAGVGLFLLLANLALADDRKITWAVIAVDGVIDLEPNSDSPRMTGIVGDLQSQLLSELEGDFTIWPVPMSIPRMHREISSQSNVCTGLMFATPERAARLHISRNYMAMPAPQIVMATEKWQQLGRPTRMSMSDLVTNPDLRGLQVVDRAFGPYIDGQMDQATNLNPPVSTYGNAVQMLIRDRADYLIEYPALIKLAMGSDSGSLRFLELEGMPTYLGIGVSCSASDLGAEFVAAVNHRLDTLARDPYYQSLNIDMAPEALRIGLTEAYTRLILAGE